MLRNTLITGFALTIVGAAFVGCSSSPKGGPAAGDGTHFSSPKVSSRDSFQADPQKYAKDMVTAVNAGIVDNYKKVVIPSYTINFQTLTYAVDQSKLGTMLMKSSVDGAANALTMGVSLPYEKYQNVMQEITKESHDRLVKKFAKIGVEVMNWEQLLAQNEEAQDFTKKRLKMDPLHVADHRATFTAPGTGRLDSIFWSAGAASLSRDVKAVVLLSNYTIGYGYFGGEKTPATIVEAHGSAEVQFTPQIQVLTGSGFNFASKYEGGRLTADHTFVNNETFAKRLLKQGDSRAAASERGDQAKGAAAAFGTGNKNDYRVSTDASVGFQMEMDPVQFKKVVMQELDMFEDTLIQRYQMEM